MKIVCVIDSLGSGGAQRQLVSLAVSFKNQGHEVTFITYHSNSFYSNLLWENSIPVIEIIEPSIIKRIYYIRKTLRSLECDAVLSFLESPNLICEISTLPRKKWKLVVGERSANPKIRTSIKLRTYRLFHILADAVVSNSHENLRLVKETNPLLNSSKFHVIYNIVDFHQWKPLNCNSSCSLDDKFTILVAARHNYLKNLDGLIEAVYLLDDVLRERLIIDWYGRSEDDSYTKAILKIRNYNLEQNFNFYPATLDIHLKVNAANAVGLFSFYEGLPNTVCEAMTNQKLVIASDVSDVKILLDSQFIFNPNDPLQISKVIKHIMLMNKHDVLKHSKLNRNRALSFFDKYRITKEYLDLLT